MEDGDILTLLYGRVSDICEIELFDVGKMVRTGRFVTQVITLDYRSTGDLKAMISEIKAFYLRDANQPNPSKITKS